MTDRQNKLFSELLQCAQHGWNGSGSPPAAIEVDDATILSWRERGPSRGLYNDILNSFDGRIASRATKALAEVYQRGAFDGGHGVQSRSVGEEGYVHCSIAPDSTPDPKVGWPLPPATITEAPNLSIIEAAEWCS